MSAADSMLRVAEYLVYLALSGKQAELKAIYMYYAENRSPSEIECELLLLSSTMICGYIGRVREKAGGHAVAKQVVEALYPKLKGCDPAVRWRPWVGWWCDLCRWQLSAVDPTQHLLRKHRREIRERAEQLLREAGLAP